MKLRTDFPIREFSHKLDYNSRILSLGSCFAESISGRLKEMKFNVEINPLGVIFNPASIAHTLVRLYENLPIKEQELHYDAGRKLWFCYELHGRFSHPDPKVLLREANRAIAMGHKALLEADTVIITMGTAYCYRHLESQAIVANCHKQPQGLFRRERLTAEQIVELYKPLFARELKRKQLLFTLSPVRHLGDGAEENSLSKALLRVAINELVEGCERADYFPAWELMMDDLRDYRFYAEDLVHPSLTAKAYLWERFCSAAFDGKTQALQNEVEALMRTLAHRPLHPESAASQRLLSELGERIARLEAQIGARFEEEKRLLSERFQ